MTMVRRMRPRVWSQWCGRGGPVDGADGWHLRIRPKLTGFWTLPTLHQAINKSIDTTPTFRWSRRFQSGTCATSPPPWVICASANTPRAISSASTVDLLFPRLLRWRSVHLPTPGRCSPGPSFPLDFVGGSTGLLYLIGSSIDSFPKVFILLFM